MIYRNIYVKKHRRIPGHLLKGQETVKYSGTMKFGLSEKPDNFDAMKDLFIDCDCYFAHVRRFERVM